MINLSTARGTSNGAAGFSLHRRTAIPANARTMAAMTDGPDQRPTYLLTAEAQEALTRYEALPVRCREHAPADLRRLSAAATDPEPTLRAHARATVGLQLLQDVSAEVRTHAGPSFTYLQEDWQDTLRHTERLVTALFGDATALAHDQVALEAARAHAAGRIETLKWEARTRAQLAAMAAAQESPATTTPLPRRRWWSRAR